ncbi:MAG: alpha/beta hydrolase [Solirubrobacterales bacterium]
MLPFGFTSRGIQLAGDLYLPEEPARPAPAVVTAPGFAGVKEMEIEPFGEALAAAGIATLAFDYAGFGSSGGEPRQHFDPAAQVRGFSDALAALAEHPAIDGDRLGVWGISMAGGHALSAAAADGRIRCAVSLAPFIANRGRPPAWLLRKVIADTPRRLLTGRDGGVAVAGRPGSRALMVGDGAEAILRMAADAPTFVNEVTVRSLVAVSKYRTDLALRSLDVPLRIIVATDDTVNPPSLVRKALAQREDNHTDIDIAVLPGTHFGFLETHRQEAIDLTVDWLRRHLLREAP